MIITNQPAPLPSVSIVLATYNGERYLERQLDSLATQKHLPSELIVGDDQSTDDTVAILKRFADRSPFPVHIVVNEQRINFRQNFFNGVKRATADLVMFCDQDDIWHSGKVQVMSELFHTRPGLLLAYHHATVVDSNEVPLGPISSPSEEETAVRSALPPPWHFARGLLQTFRRELSRFDALIPLSREHFSPDILAHDRWYMMLALALGRVEFIRDDLLLYRQHGANTYGSDRVRSWAERIKDRLQHHAITDRFGAAAAWSRVAILEQIAPSVEAGDAARLHALAGEYRRLAGRLERRHRTYTAPTPAARGAALGRSVLQGDYRGNPWGFDPLSIVRDAWTGVAGVGPKITI